MVAHLARGGDVGERQSDAGELAGEELGVGLGALGDAPVELGLGAVARLLPVLGEQDERRGVGGLEAEQQGEADELPLVEAQRAGAEHVPHDPHGTEDALVHEEPGRADEPGDALAELAERVVVVVDAEQAPLARRGEVVAAGHGRPPDPPDDAGMVAVVVVVVTRRRCRQPVGRVRSSTSSTVIAPSSRLASSQTPTASML